MVKVVIFDFDLTIFNSTEIKYFMDKKQWTMVYKNIHKCSIYNNVRDILYELKNKNIYIALVSNAPSIYIKKALNFFNLKFDFIVCYHDVNKPKPNPEGINMVLKHFSVDKSEAFYVGNDDIDYKTAYNAKINFFGVPWGTFSQKVQLIHYENHIDIFEKIKNNYSL